jgi:cobalt-zinc-cadmium efflux system outer membrane protein
VVARQRAERELATARRTLAATWGGSRATFTRAAGTLGSLGRVPSEDEIFGGLARNPELARWEMEREERAAAVALAEAARVPNVTVGAGGRHFSDTGDNALVFEVSVPLPIVNRNQGGVAEARARLGKAGAERDAVDVTLRTAVADAYARLVGAHDEVTALRAGLLPEAESALAGATDGFHKGLFRLTDVLDAQRTLYDLRADEVQALEAFHLAAADLERLTASRLDAAGDGDRDGEGEAR